MDLLGNLMSSEPLENPLVWGTFMLHKGLSLILSSMNNGNAQTYTNWTISHGIVP